MRTSDEDIVRRALLTVLERLEGGAVGETRIAGGAGVNQSTANHPMSSRANVGGDNPIVLIVLGQLDADGHGSHSLDAQPADPRKAMRESPAPADLKPYGMEFAVDRQAAQSMHPGLEKFPVSEHETAPSAPKTCFMEPGRHCVNSGACEMRGY